MTSNKDFGNMSNEYHEEVLDNFFDKIRIKEVKSKRVHLESYDNNSGMGEKAPDNIANKFNWGAFLFNWIWGIKYKKWFLLLILPLLFIPMGFVFAFVIAVWAGFCGNNWAWAEVQYKDEQDFNYSQSLWVKWWLGLVSGLVVVATITFLCLTPKSKMEIFEDYNSSLFVTKELPIPNEVFENTSFNDDISKLLLAGKYIVYWQYQDTDVMKKNKQLIEDLMEQQEESVKSQFILYPELIKSPKAKENIANENEESLADEKVNNDISKMDFSEWLKQKCNTGYCIINPKKKIYYKVRGSKKVVLKAKKLLKVWN